MKAALFERGVEESDLAEKAEGEVQELWGLR